MKLFFAAFFITIYSFVGLQAQSFYRGVVIDKSNGKALDAVSVSLLTADSSVVNYTHTNEDGSFKLKSTASDSLLSFSSIGYKRQILPIVQFRNGMKIELEETTMQIKEVKIVSNRIRKLNDTLSYSVSGFKMPQDRSIEDVLKKIPGIEVTPNGTIKFQDKPISNFYIEGMNLLEERYALGSRNISADMVKEVQILQAHQPITALKGKAFSDNAALNLTLNDNARSKLIKIIDLGVGVGNGGGVLWDNRLLGILFGKKMQNLTMYKNNNTGTDIAAEIVPLTQTGVINLANGNSEEDFFASSTSRNANIDPERYLFNNSHLAAINHLYKPNQKTDLRLQFSALHNEETFRRQSGTTYFYPSQTVIIDEAENYFGHENRAEGEVTYLINDSAIYIKNTLKGTIGLYKSNLELTVNKQKINERIHPERKFLQNSFELIKNMGKRVLSIHSTNIYTELPQIMTVAPGPFEELLNNGEAYNLLKQEAFLRAFQSNTYTYFQHKIAGFYLKYKVGFKYNNKQMTSAIYTDSSPAKEKNLFNYLIMNTIKLYAEPSLNYKNSFWDIQASVPFSLLYMNLRYRSPEIRKTDEKRIMPMPELNIKHEMNAYWNATLLSSYSYIEPDIRQLYTGYLFSSYRSATAYASQPNYDKSWYSMLGVRFNDPLAGLFVSATGFFNLSRQDVVYSYENTNNYLTLCKATPLPHNNYLWGARGRLSKAYAWSKLYTALSTGYSQNKNQMMLEEELITSSLKVLNVRFDFSLQPSRYVNIDGNSAASHIESSLNYAGNEAVKTWRYRHELNLNLIFSSRWKARLANTLSHESHNRIFTYFADASVIFSHRLFNIELCGHNLFNHSRINNVYVSGLTEQYTNYILRPQEFLLKMTFSF